MKKIVSFLIIFIVAMQLTACGNKNANLASTAAPVAPVTPSPVVEKMEITMNPSDDVTVITDNHYYVKWDAVDGNKALLDAFNIDSTDHEFKVEYAPIDDSGNVGTYSDKFNYELGDYSVKISAGSGNSYTEKEFEVTVNGTNVYKSAAGHALVNYGDVTYEDFEIVNIGSGESNMIDYCERTGTRVYCPNICDVIDSGVYANGEINGASTTEAVTRRGISIGSTRDDVLAAYGTEDYIEYYDELIPYGTQYVYFGTAYNYEYTDSHIYHLWFMFDEKGSLVDMCNESYWK